MAVTATRNGRSCCERLITFSPPLECGTQMAAGNSDAANCRRDRNHHQDILGVQVNSPSTLAVTSTSSDLVKGFVTIDGTAIVKGELTLKLPHYNRGNALKVAINPSQPAYLQQLITVQNYLVLAQQAFIRVPRSARNRAGLLKASKALSRVREADTFPAKECDAKCFSPDLPEDLIVEFFVKHSSLMVSIRALNFQQQGIPLQIQSKILGKFRNMRIETYKGRPVEILDELTVGSASPRLVTLIRSLNTIAGLCEDMHMKLQMFK
ncbi:Rogdi leucine zipper containing protein-domain-containing protein [Powellomyces hirtus]|nr:Rogdi leucine zipper containing protein-domain-containing protein [Powellomyces hirtus]